MKYQALINNGIKRLRKSYGLTQEQFAEKVYLTIESVRNIEHNKYTPTAKTIDSICAAFNITPFDLLLPEANSNAELIEAINKRLKLCSNDELQYFSDFIDMTKKTFGNK